MTSIESSFDEPWETTEPTVQVFEAPGFPSGHPAEPDLFVRQERIPGHDPGALERARVVMVGAGGLGSWTGLGLVRSGARDLTVIDPDRFDRTNAHRQLMFAADRGRPKASSLARNLVPHMIAGGRITAINERFEDALKALLCEPSVLLVLVDNNGARLRAARWARQHGIPAVFTMLSASDGGRVHCFSQGSAPTDACLACALPNLDPETAVPCAASIISTCLLAASMTLFFAHEAVAARQNSSSNWRESDLFGRMQETIGRVERRLSCPACSGIVPIS